MVHCICDENEKKMLENFWEAAKEVDLFIGFNIMDFDMKYIIQRSIIHGVKPKTKVRLSFARYRSEPIYDAMHEWNQWDMAEMFLLTHWRGRWALVHPKPIWTGRKFSPITKKEIQRNMRLLQRGCGGDKKDL